MSNRREFITLLGSAAVGLPAATLAQQPTMPVVGYLTGGSLTEADVMAFREGLKESGYEEARNLSVKYRSADGRHDLLPALAADLVRGRVSVIATYGTPSTLAAKAATATIPIIFEVGVDPVTFGLVSNFPRPEGNITGFHVLNVMVSGKRLEFLRVLLPTTVVMGLLTNSSSAFSVPETRELQDASQSLGLKLEILNATNESEIDLAFATSARAGAGALVVSADVPFINWRDQFVALAARHRVPVIYPYREYVLRGGLMSYGPSLTDINRKLGGYSALILKGKKPAELPVQQLVKVELVVNLRTAKALGLEVPPVLLARADEVIE